MTRKKTSKSAAATGYMGISGAELLHEMLLEQGVETMFGYPGGMVLPFFDVLYSSPIKFVLTRHEQGAAHMADGYSRATGKTGVVLATSGPGATNLVTGLATANMDSIPIVAFTGQVRSHLIGNDAFQEADITGITRPVVKHNYLVKRVEDLGRTVREAFHIARTGRPGPVVVDIAIDATTAKLAEEPDLELRLPGYKPQTVGNVRQVKLAAEAINASERPVLYVGGGVVLAGASDLMRAIATKGSIPVTTTLLGLGSFDESSPLALQMLGMHGSASANFAVQDCDCLIAVGARFDDRVTGNLANFAPNAKIIHIDVDPASISKNVVVDIPVVGDAKDILTKMLPLIQEKDRSPWVSRITEWKRRYPFRYDADGHIKPQEVIETIGKMTDHDAVVATGVGQHQMWSAQFYGWRRPRQIITSGGLGTMGFGCPASIGAQFALPGATVIDIDGDGSFSMTMVEVITAVQYQQPVKFVVLDNGFLGMVRQWQEMFYGRRYSSVVHKCPDFAGLARAFGAHGIRVSERSELADAVGEMLKHEGPVVLHAEVEPEENVYPMVPAGKSLHEMELGKLA
ncbi:MAG: Acetolactate synthase large subunit [Planctomycetes bacterium ADurb.Bin126]|nr:MAG: Acetolactate synthase large subunit [Planctomycetes bacterium ADurb.Bin126]HOD81009.1 biosynthetic-type acetolactate synthase large subunit [Phycisphaerae bacterium]HQL73310.1 biosynthetic-type acetolactate synthase large subunit [Phycisphaerae bacterium]